MTHIKEIAYQDERAVEVTMPAFRLVAIAARGPRIAWFGPPDGDNLLLWAPGKYRRGEWDLMGGHRLWVARPGADEAEETYAADNAPCSLEIAPDGFTLTGALDPQFRIRRGFTMRVLADDRLHIDHFVRNEGDMLFSGGIWVLTCTVPGKDSTYHVPLGDGSRWDTATIVAFRTWGGGHAGGFGDSQFTTTDDAFILRPSGHENKRMVRADAGIVAMHDPARNVLFAKQAAYQPEGVYPLCTNIALYVGPDNFMVEMETMGPNATLKPGAMFCHAETWVLRKAEGAPPSASALRTLFR